jgi:hypothetical protein
MIQNRRIIKHFKIINLKQILIFKRLSKFLIFLLVPNYAVR